MGAFASSFAKTILLGGGAFLLASAALAGADDRTRADCGAIAGGRWIHIVATGETWRSIGARVGVDPAVLAARNARTLRTPLKPGDVLGIDNRHVAPPYDGTRLVVNVPQRMLFHYSEGALRAHYPVAVGRADWQTPLGSFTVLAAETDPTWDVPISIQEEMRRAGKPIIKAMPPGPTNPLGRYWLALSLGSVGLHGTNAPSSIYQFATHGCIRLHPDDIEDLFYRVDAGEPGRIVYEPVLVAFDGVDVFLEVHRDRYRRSPNPLGRAMELVDRAGLLERVDVTEIARVVREAEGLAVAVTRR